MEPAAPPEASIVVALDASSERLPILVAHLEHQTWPASRFEVILVAPPRSPYILAAAQRSAEGSPIPIRVFESPLPYLTIALNTGIRAARGSYVVLLDSELLPSPHFLEQHMLAQRQHDAPVCTVGALQSHPQLERDALTGWFMSGARHLAGAEGALGYLHWRRYNMALPRETLLACGGFDEQSTNPYFCDAEMAFRLCQQDVGGMYLPKAVAYISYPSGFDVEMERHYRKGAALFRLHQMCKDPTLLKQYPVYRNPLRRLLDAIFVPFYIRGCLGAPPNTRLLGHVYERVFFYQRSRGYSHAARAARMLRRV